MKTYSNTTLKKEETLLINAMTTEEWDLCDHVAEKGETLFSRDVVSGVPVYNEKIGDGVNTWADLPYYYRGSTNNYIPIRSLTIDDFEPTSDGTIYNNTQWKGCEFKVFNQTASRFLEPYEIQPLSTGGFELIGGFRIYESQTFIAIF